MIGTRAIAQERRSFDPMLIALVGIMATGIAFGTVRSPFLVAGLVLGCAVLATAMVAPLALVALMLMVGPVDLSFVTGGFKSLFPELGGLDMNGIRLIGATGGFLVYILFEPRSRGAVLGKLGRPWFVFLAYAAATLAFSLDRIEGARLLLKLMYPFLTFLIVVGVADSRARIRTLVRCILITAAVFTLIINPVLAYQGGYRIDPDGIKRIGGLGSGDSPFSFYLMAVLFITFTRFVLRNRPIYLVFSMILLVWIALTVTRIAALGSLVGLGVIGVLAAYAAGNRKVLIATLAVAIVGGIILTPNVLRRSLGFLPTPMELFQIVRNPVVLYNSINWQGRQLLWAILWAAFISAPIFGLGMGSSAVVIHEAFPNQNVKVAHNEYMRLATDTGLVGVALFAVATITWLVTAIRLCKVEDDFVRELAFPAVAAIIGWGLIAITDNPFDYYGPFTQYAAFLVAAAVAANSLRDEGVMEAAS